MLRGQLAMTLEVSHDNPLQATDAPRTDNRPGAASVAAALPGSAAGHIGVLYPNHQLPLWTC